MGPLLCLCAAAILVSKGHGAPDIGTSEQSHHGAIEAVVTFAGKIPEDPVADDAGRHHLLLEVDNQTRGLHHVVAYLTASSGKALPTHGAGSSKKSATIDQVNHTFTPRVVAVFHGDTVKFTNSDPANHNVRSASLEPRNEFNVFTGVDGSYEHRFLRTSNSRPIRLTCDIHPWMRAWIYVFDHPWYGTTDRKGALRIPSIPPGTYDVIIEQPDISYRKREMVVVKSNQTTRLTFEITDRDLRPFKSP